MEEEFYASRTYLRQLLSDHPDWTNAQYAEATGRSLRWVKEWKKRLRAASRDDEAVLQGRSRRPHQLPEPYAPALIERILAIRDLPPNQLQRTPGPKAIRYYLEQDEELRLSGARLPQTTTIWKILTAHGRIPRRQRPTHEPLPRPAPLVAWQLDFKDVSSVPADPQGKQQHGVETLNGVDVGTSIVLDAAVRDDFAADTAIVAVTDTLRNHGLPQTVTYDRDPRFVGSWSGQDFPAAFTRFWLCLGVAVNLCPPQRPDKNAFVEGYHRNYEYECLQIHRPSNREEAEAVTRHYVWHYNHQRPNQALTCGNQPPRVAFPDLPQRPRLPQVIDPDGWLKAIHGRRYVRKVNYRGAIQIDNHAYYIQSRLQGQYVTVGVDAQQRRLVIEHHKQRIKSVALKGLYHTLLPFEQYLKLIQEEARAQWRRLLRERRLKRHAA